jgi:hypothetical protein
MDSTHRLSNRLVSSITVLCNCTFAIVVGVADMVGELDVLPARTAAATRGAQEGEGMSDCLVSLPLLLRHSLGVANQTRKHGLIR